MGNLGDKKEEEQETGRKSEIKQKNKFIKNYRLLAWEKINTRRGEFIPLVLIIHFLKVRNFFFIA